MANATHPGAAKTKKSTPAAEEHRSFPVVGIGASAKLQQLSLAETLQPYATRRLTKGGAVVEVSVVSTALLDGAGRLYAVATTERARGATPAPSSEDSRG